MIEILSNIVYNANLEIRRWYMYGGLHKLLVLFLLVEQILLIKLVAFWITHRKAGYEKDNH